MKLAIMQPYFFPYIGYFQLINTVDKFIIFDDVNYIKKGWINRNRIWINGQEYIFTIPLEKTSQNKLINEINLSKDTKWKDKLVKTIETGYKKAPMFKSIFLILTDIIYNNEGNLSRYLSNSLEILCDYLQIRTRIVKSSVPYGTASLKGQEKIIEICKMEMASNYFNPIGGLEIYNKGTFEKQKINLSFLRSNPIKYTQTGTKFVPNLSIIDVMMFNSTDKISDFLNEFEVQ